jgi:hypothetical protein
MGRFRTLFIPTTLLTVAALSACSSSTQTGDTPAASRPPASSSSSPTGTGTHAVTPKRTASPTPSPPHATEFNPPGDIPDNAVFVDHTAPGTTVHFSVPEGWARSRTGGVTTYTDNYNSISIEVRSARHAPTVRSAGHELQQLRRTVSHFQLQGITTVQRKHGQAVHVLYLMDSAPNPVTGKVVRDAVERFEFWHAGQLAVLSLAGPQNADNVDPWQLVSDSLHWQ